MIVFWVQDVVLSLERQLVRIVRGRLLLSVRPLNAAFLIAVEGLGPRLAAMP